MARPKKRKYVSKIQKMINKGVYTARPKGRPPKGKEWNYKTGQYETRFPADLLKAANERLRKLEKVSQKASSSEIYQLMSKYATSYSKTKGKIYSQEAIAQGKVRFLNKTDFNKLSAEDKKYYLERLEQFMSSKSSTLTGIKESHKKSYETFMQLYGDKYPELTQKQYEEFFSTYNANVVGDSMDHFSYSDWSRVLTNIKIDEAMSDNQMQNVMTYIRANDWVGLSRDQELRRYLLRV